VSAYTDAVEHNLRGVEHVSVGRCQTCPECGFEEGESGDDEGGFSRSPCDACGTHMSGNRYAAHGLVASVDGMNPTLLCHFDVCADCLAYLVNGTEPEEWDD